MAVRVEGDVLPGEAGAIEVFAEGADQGDDAEAAAGFVVETIEEGMGAGPVAGGMGLDQGGEDSSDLGVEDPFGIDVEAEPADDDIHGEGHFEEEKLLVGDALTRVGVGF